MTVDLEWLVYFGMYYKDFTAMLENDRENDRDESHQIFYVSAEPSANGVYFPIKRRSLQLEHLSSCSEETPAIVQSFSFSI